MNQIITFTKVSKPYGWLGNMMKCPISYKMKLWDSTEALFQSMRYTDENIKKAIREAENGYKAKQVAKQYIDNLSIMPGSEEDLDNMRICLNLKIEQHPNLKELLILTEDKLIIEDCTKRGKTTSNLFWGAVLENDEWIGENWMGKLWMELREKNIKI